MQVTLKGAGGWAGSNGVVTGTKGLLYPSISQDTVPKLFFHQQHWKQTYLLMQFHSAKHGESCRGIKTPSFFHEITSSNSERQMPNPIEGKAAGAVLQVFSCTAFDCSQRPASPPKVI